jgi:isocitrate lyase
MIGSIVSRALSSGINQSSENWPDGRCRRYPCRRPSWRFRSSATPEVLTAMPQQTSERLTREWASEPRWRGIRRDYGAEEVLRLRTVVQPEHTLARHGAERLWALLAERDHLPALGALTGGQAVQMVNAGL